MSSWQIVILSRKVSSCSKIPFLSHLARIFPPLCQASTSPHNNSHKCHLIRTIKPPKKKKRRLKPGTCSANPTTAPHVASCTPDPRRSGVTRYWWEFQSTRDDGPRARIKKPTHNLESIGWLRVTIPAPCGLGWEGEGLGAEKL